MIQNESILLFIIENSEGETNLKTKRKVKYFSWLDALMQISKKKVSSQLDKTNKYSTVEREDRETFVKRQEEYCVDH